MYRPSIGVWLSDDPIGFAGGQENFYEFVGDNPTNMTDPSGLGPFFATPLLDAHLKGPTEKERREAIAIRNRTIEAWIDEKTVYSAEEKKKAKEAIVKVMNAADFSWPYPTGYFGYCEKWTEAYLKQLGEIKSDHGAYFRISDQTFEGPIYGDHVVVRITFRDGTEIYMDDGNWGGLDRLFMPTEVGTNYTPVNGPDQWFEPTPEFRRDKYVPGWFGLPSRSKSIFD